ncbi:hypothetical protein DKM19_08590 [Streptosporangium sp. 'caverna']|nr:hypothetical protein DKM19_08590 [Streptosporangium sp. 'caverna']
MISTRSADHALTCPCHSGDTAPEIREDEAIDRLVLPAVTTRGPARRDGHPDGANIPAAPPERAHARPLAPEHGR